MSTHTTEGRPHAQTHTDAPDALVQEVQEFNQSGELHEGYLNKNEYQRKLKAEINQVNHRIDEFFKKFSESIQIEVSAEQQAMIQGLVEQREALIQRGEKIEQATSEAWHDLQVGLNESLSQLKNSVDKAFARFNLSDDES